MAKDRQDITEAEMALMQVLWRRPAVSIRQIADEMHGGGRASAGQYATIQKQLERLENKGFVNRDRTLFVHLFSAAVDRDELIGRRLRDMAEKLCEGSLAPVVSHLARSTSLTSQERKALRKLFEQLYGGGDDQAKRKR